MVTQKEKEKEKTDKIKALRRELEEKIEEQLPEEMLEDGIKVEVKKVDDQQVLDPEKAKSVVEALLFASSKPLTALDIRKVVKSLSVGQVNKMVSELKSEYEEAGRSFEILEIANGFEIATRKEYAPWIMRSELQKKAKQVTQSALECLSILAYKQPITRAEIEELRGVDGSGVLATLTDRGLVKIVGKKDVPGRPFLYGTTEKFLEHFGLKSLKELPDISEIQTLVQTAIKKDDLLGAQNIVSNQEAVSAESGIVEGVDENNAPEENVVQENDIDEVEAEIDDAVGVEETPKEN